MIEDELGALLAEHAERLSVPGAAIGILRGGVVSTAIYGTANVVTGEAVTAETRFSVGSLTKSMVATVIVGLADAGRLTLDDPVSAHVTELRGGGWAERATVLDLLANRSGLPLRAALEFGFAAYRDTDDGALARLVAEIDADVPARAVWSYTNVGWCVLGRVIETVTGDTWEVAMRQHLFDRAGMTGTTFATGSEPVHRVVGHDITPGGAVAVEPLVARAYAQLERVSFRRSRTCSASLASTSRTRRWLRFASSGPMCRSTAGSMRGVSGGLGSIGKAALSGGGTVSSAASDRRYGSSRSTTPQSCC